MLVYIKPQLSKLMQEKQHTWIKMHKKGKENLR